MYKNIQSVKYCNFNIVEMCTVTEMHFVLTWAEFKPTPLVHCSTYSLSALCDEVSTRLMKL